MRVLLIATVTILVTALPVMGYEVVSVTDGATINGYVRFTGSVPADELIKIDRDTEVCGSERAARKYLISKGVVKNAVVWLDGVKKGRALTPKDVWITIKNCEVEPLVNVGFVGGRFIFRNEDPILHTLQLKLGLEYHKTLSQRPLEDGATIYNIALPKKGMKVEKPIKEYHSYSADRGYVRIKSNAHSWLRGYVFVFDHPYGAVTDETGSFNLEGILPGEYTLMVWHEGFGFKKVKISLKKGERKDVEINLSP
ncbi:MAG: carboxypeptidase regulatory-like domain-containing protein [Thermodesulfovibrionales bacterium]